MKRTYASGAEKRRKKAEMEKKRQCLPRISSFFAKSKEKESAPDNNEIVDDVLISSSSSATSVNTIPTSNKELTSVDELDNIPTISRTNDETVALESPPDHLYSSNKIVDNVISLTISPTDDIAFLNKNNTMQMEAFLKISHFDIPENISADAENNKFPYRLLKKILPNGESCKRDWLCWSKQKLSLFCVPCFLNRTDLSLSVLSSPSGWNIEKGWRKLKDRIPSHENSIKHKENYVHWKSQVNNASSNSTLRCLVLKQITDEAENWGQLLQRILEVILFLSERGLAFLGSSERIGDAHNGNFLGIVELLSKYDPILYNHVKKIRTSQEKNKRLQVHYLSSFIQNEFIEICGSFVQNKILEEIRNSKYFSIIVDATPDCSHKEQTSLIIRYLKLFDDSKFSIEERFIIFDSFTQKKGFEIAQRILELLKQLELDFNFCIGQSYDNGANMAGKYNGVYKQFY